MNIGQIWASIVEFVLLWFKKDEKILLDFFGPLLDQVKQQALVLGKQDLEAGLVLLQKAAMAAVEAAEQAPGDKVKAAEEAFVKAITENGADLANTMKSQALGLKDIILNNAETAAIKAAVAIIQSQSTPTPPASNTTPTANTN
jgi:hypothetical protein